tara:strand:+ start:698 stop:925 length:228 start_codon:yes stop_codon:yes gene_type:complete
MKSKNIPADIKAKSINDAKKEIQEILYSLESSETKLENSLELYNRMLHLNYHIQEEFKKKSHLIKKSLPDKSVKV